MPMTRNELLDAIVDDGTTEMPLRYPNPDQRLKRDGAIAGFEACRCLDDQALLALLARATAQRRHAQDVDDPRYWWHRLFEAQVEWTLNVLSAANMAQGLATLVPPTARGMAKAMDILR